MPNVCCAYVCRFRPATSFLPKVRRSTINQVLKVGICGLNFGCHWEFFYAKIGKDGRIFIPKLTVSLLQGEKPSLAGIIFEIKLEPT